MTADVLVARVEEDEAGRTRVLAPAIGFWSDVPAPGAFLGPGSRIGVLGRSSLVLPPGVAGRITDGLPEDRVVPVEHGQLLFVLAPIDGAAGDGASHVHGSSRAAALPAGLFGLEAPTDGIFYASPSPGGPPFVHVGSRIAAGQPVGLVEVMKTFNQVLYGGAGLPDPAEVREVRCGDREEIRAGQLLIVVGPCST